MKTILFMFLYLSLLNCEVVKSYPSDQKFFSDGTFQDNISDCNKLKCGTVCIERTYLCPRFPICKYLNIVQI